MVRRKVAMKARIELVKQFDVENLKKMFELVNIVFPPKYYIPFEQYEAINKKNPRVRAHCWLGDELAGFINFYPLTTDAYEQFLASHEVYDMKITADEIMEYGDKNHVYDIFIPSIVMNPIHQGKMLGLILMRGLMLGLKELKAEGYKLGRLGATAYTDAGMHQLKTYMALKEVRLLNPATKIPGFDQMFTDVAVSGDCEKAIHLIEEYMGIEGLL